MNLPYISGMFVARVFIIFMVSIICRTDAFGQQDEFCDAVTVIIRDAQNKFRNIRGKLQDANSNATLWDCGIKIPGTIKSRFIGGMGLFYEGALLQTQNKEDVQGIYDRYKGMLTNCLSSQGYTLTEQDNFYPGLEHFKKLVYMMDFKEDSLPEHPPAHVALEATYSKQLKLYTVVMYIFEH